MLHSPLLLLLLLQSVVFDADEIEKVSLRPGTEMERAELFVWKPGKVPTSAVHGASPPVGDRAIHTHAEGGRQAGTVEQTERTAPLVAALVLCPGCNGSGESLVRDRAWREFAAKHRLGLVGLSFASDPALLTSGRGYYYASRGSGELLREGIRNVYGKDLPLLLYGFSGGAHFTARYAEWKPESVLAWCAYSAGWWDQPEAAGTCPPGIVACGDEDERYGASLFYFKQGRAMGKPWLWISVPKTGHAVAAGFEEFVRAYFAAALAPREGLNPGRARMIARRGAENAEGRGRDNPRPDGVWLDIDRETEADTETVRTMPTVTAWLPDRQLLQGWMEMHEP